MVVDQLELTDVAVLLHDLQELHHNLGAGTEENLALTTALCSSEGAQSNCEDGHAGHFTCVSFLRERVERVELEIKIKGKENKKGKNGLSGVRVVEGLPMTVLTIHGRKYICVSGILMRSIDAFGCSLSKVDAGSDQCHS